MIISETTQRRDRQGLTHLPDGRWRIRVEGPRQPDRRRQQVSATLPTKRAALQWRATTLARLLQAAATAPPLGTTINEAADAWLAQKAVSVRAVTMAGYTSALAPARAAFGEVPVVALTPEHVRTLVRDLAPTRTKRTVALTIFVVRSVLASAVDDGLVTKNVAARVQPAGRPSRRRANLPAADAVTITNHVVGDRLEGCWLLSLAGLRRSEVLGLCWSDLDLQDGWVTISRGRVEVSASQTDVNAPKSTRSARSVPLSPQLVAGLRRTRTQRAAEHLHVGIPWDEDGYIGVEPDLSPLRPEAYSDGWLRLCDDAGVPRVTLHAARHGSVTRMMAAGVPVHVVAAWHGHDPAVALRTYAHVDRDDLRLASQALAAGSA